MRDNRCKTNEAGITPTENRLWVFLLLFALCGLASMFKSSGIWAVQLSQLEWRVGGDKHLHFLVACALSFLSVWVTSLSQRRLFGLLGWPTLLLLLAVTIDELSQYYLPRREFAFSDLVVNYVGILFGTTVCLLVRYLGCKAK